MEVSRIEHINITADADVIERCRRFYVEVLGLTDGSRPPFATSGHWLYAAGEPLVHLTIGAGRTHLPAGSAFDHVALACRGLEECLERLRSAGVDFTRSHVPATGVVQLFLADPAGVPLELQFTPPR